jgi:rod shape-determining protein MreC
MRLMSSASPHPLGWLSLFVGLSIGATFVGSWQGLEIPRQAVARVVAPLQAGVSRVGYTVSDVVSGWQELGQLRQENEVLRQTVDELLQETVRLRAAELENRELREQLRYTRESSEHTLVSAQVIGFDSSALLGYAVINRGSDAQVGDGMVVVSTAGLVGRVTSRTGRTSKVQLITAPGSTVNAMIQGQPAATGLADGLPDGRLRMRYIPQSEPVRVNDVVVTSGLGGAFPRDLPIGRVVHVESRDIDLFQQAIVEPFVNFRKLSHVLVNVTFVPTKL